MYQYLSRPRRACAQACLSRPQRACVQAYLSHPRWLCTKADPLHHWSCCSSPAHPRWACLQACVCAFYDVRPSLLQVCLWALPYDYTRVSPLPPPSMVEDSLIGADSCSRDSPCTFSKNVQQTTCYSYSSFC